MQYFRYLRSELLDTIHCGYYNEINRVARTAKRAWGPEPGGDTWFLYFEGLVVLELKKPASIDEQIQRLIYHKMDIADAEFAKQVLSEINYYRFTGYAIQFRDTVNKDDYIPDTKFETVWRLHCFDSELRSILKTYLDIVELYARTKIAYEFSMKKCIKPPHNQHYDPSNFHNKHSHNKIIIDGLDRAKKNSKDSLFVKHHEINYGGIMPLWVAMELLSFTNLSKLFSAMFRNDQDAIARSMGTTCITLKNHLHCLANLRNKVAHAGRLYNIAYNPPAMLGRKYLQRNPGIKIDMFFAYLITLIRRCPNKQTKEVLINDMENIMQKYIDCIQLPLLGFPNDYMFHLNNAIK